MASKGNTVGCDACVIGRYSDLPSLKDCTECPIGYKGTGTGGATSDSTCSICAAGFFAGPTGGQDACQICAAGFYLPAGTFIFFYIDYLLFYRSSDVLRN